MYSCVICGVRMCPESCFQRYHILEDYYYKSMMVSCVMDLDDSKRQEGDLIEEREGVHCKINCYF